MKREIKFRGKRVDNGEWVYGWYHGNVGDENEAFIMDFEMGIPQPVILETVGQLLHRDKEGKEWYEGDINKTTINYCTDGHPVTGDDEWFNGTKVGLVVWDKRNGAAVKNGVVTNSDTGEQNKTNSAKAISFFRSSVIGNIYDTPELLNTHPVNP